MDADSDNHFVSVASEPMKPNWYLYCILAACMIWLGVSIVTMASPACAAGGYSASSGNCDMKDTSPCALCMNETSGLESSGTALGGYMISQMFLVINQILTKIQTTFYNGIINSPTFQQAIGVCFLFYITVYGIMIMLNLASYRSGEVISRLIKLAIVYALTTSGGWTFFSTFIEQPVVNEMNQLITTIGNASGSSGGRCSSTGTFSGAAPVTASGAASSGILSVQLSTGPMAMLYGPMSCVFAAQFIGSIMALITGSGYSWLLAGALLWGLVEFSKMVLGAIVTYVKAIVGLTVLFGIAPIFFAFYLFEKTRAMTMQWFSMVFGFALQPVMLFAFLAIFASIVGGAITNMLSDASGQPIDLCYVPWYTMPKMFDIYWMKFKNSSHAAGGMFIPASGATGADSQLPVQVLNVLYFVVLCNLGKNFCDYINDLSTTVTGGTGAGVTTGDKVGRMFSGMGKSVAKGITGGGPKTTAPRPPIKNS